jgi:hypothetical protein
VSCLLIFAPPPHTHTHTEVTTHFHSEVKCVELVLCSPIRLHSTEGQLCFQFN